MLIASSHVDPYLPLLPEILKPVLAAATVADSLMTPRSDGGERCACVHRESHRNAGNE